MDLKGTPTFDGSVEGKGSKKEMEMTVSEVT